MKPLDLPEPKKSAKAFLCNMVPSLLRACGVEATQSFLGFKVNIEVEAQKRVNAMTENQAKWALDALKELLKEW